MFYRLNFSDKTAPFLPYATTPSGQCPSAYLGVGKRSSAIWALVRIRRTHAVVSLNFRLNVPGPGLGSHIWVGCGDSAAPGSGCWFIHTKCSVQGRESAPTRGFPRHPDKLVPKGSRIRPTITQTMLLNEEQRENHPRSNCCNLRTYGWKSRCRSIDRSINCISRCTWNSTICMDIEAGRRCSQCGNLQLSLLSDVSATASSTDMKAPDACWSH